MNILESTTCEGTHAQASVRRKCKEWQKTEVCDKWGGKSIKSEVPMGFDSILTTSPLVKVGLVLRIMEHLLISDIR